jgi:hypothetical protein
MKPVLSVFHGMKGNKQWRVELDQLCRNTSLRTELGPSGILHEAIKSIDEEILDSPLTTAN